MKTNKHNNWQSGTSVAVETEDSLFQALNVDFDVDVNMRSDDSGIAAFQNSRPVTADARASAHVAAA